MDRWTWIWKRAVLQSYDDDSDLVTSDESSCHGESKAESHNESVPHEMIFAKEKIWISLEKLSTFVGDFTVCKFCNNPTQGEEDSYKLAGLACFLKIVYQNEKSLKSKMNSSVNMSNKKSQFFEINPFVLAYHLIGHGPSAAKKLTSVLNMTQSISKRAWKRQTDVAVNVSNNSMKKAALEVKETSSQQHFIHTQGRFVRRSHRSKLRCWWLLGLQRIFVVPRDKRHLFRRNWKSNWYYSKK